ncbi:MAG: ParB/RepB/Spo0J family partition protein [Bacilli bacterium]|jgi:ParB family chromosome partitioning protein|nr:ParB/RepB/Spo0J family partition protein [Bacilli bacterium]
MNLEERVLQVPIEDIIPNRFQPRLTFDDRGLEELASSIKQHGIIQPLVLRRVNDKYEIIAGERRYKAATMAGLSTVPAIVSNIDDNQSAEVAIVENVQRRNLTPIEEARSYKNLLDKGYLTQSELAKKMGISQSAIANKLRLLNLDEEVQQALLNNQISERHARSLLVLSNPEDQKKWLQKIIAERLTVRQLDDALKSQTSDNSSNNEDDDTDIPLVRSLDIEAIRKEATELPKINEDSDIAKKLQEIERERMFNPEVIPVEQATNESKGNFFNFLENEKVNMNMEEINLQAPAINLDMPKINENFNKPEPMPEMVMPKVKDNPIKNEPAINIDITEPKQELTSNEEAALNFNSNFGTNPVIETKPEINLNDDNFDPVNLIDTLDPAYHNKVEEKMGIDLKTAINEIRDAKDTLSMKGFNISLEETDLNDCYQFTIKIKKN